MDIPTSYEPVTCILMVASRVAFDVEVEQLADWLYCLRTPVVQAYAVRQSSGFVLVDTGVVGYGAAYLEAIAQATDLEPEDVRISEILLTHGHDDHTGSARELVRMTGAQVRGPALDADVIEGRARRADPQLAEWEVPLYERLGTPAALKARGVLPAPPVDLDGQLEAGSRLGWELPTEVIAVPGHTAGSLAVFFPSERVLIAGDAIASYEGEPILGVFNVDLVEARHSFARLAELDADLACYGHGAPIVGDAQAKLGRVASAFP